jgi:hypothetical protein
VAYRCAPLAFLIEENCSPPSTGLRQIALSSDWVYACHARMGGSGWGSVIRFKRPPLLKKSNDGNRATPSPDRMDWNALKQIVGSVEELADEPCEYLCSSWDGSLIFFANPYHGSYDVFLIRKDGKPEAVTIQSLADLFK